MRPAKLFENESYRVLRCDAAPETRLSVVCFEPWMHARSAREPGPFQDIGQDNFVTRKGMNAIFVQTRRNDWYQGDGIHDALDAVAARRRAGEILISYGTSMGGHAAASFSAHLQADYFFSASAQVSLCPTFMNQILDRRWHESHAAFRYDNILDRACRDQSGLVCYDTAQLHDRIHAERMVRDTAARGLDCPGTWHFAAALVQRELGVMTLLRDIAASLRDSGDAQGPLARLEEVLAGSFAARFLAADGAGMEGLVAEAGLDRVARDIHLNALVRAFELDPTRELAGILCALEAQLEQASQKAFVTRMLLRKGYDDLAPVAIAVPGRG